MTEAKMYDRTDGEQTGWTGWIVFASVMMVVGGFLNLTYGFIALVNDTWVGWNQDTASAVVLDLTAWGWLHIGLGACLVLAGFGVMTGNIVARSVGVIVAAVSIVGNFYFIPVYPFWSLTVIVLDVLVIWALTVHGREMRRA